MADKEILKLDLFIKLMKEINSVFWTNTAFFIKFDIYRYYLNITFDNVNKVLKKISLWKYWIVTNLVKNIISVIDFNKDKIFVSNWLGLYLWNIVSYYLSKLISIYIAINVNARLVFVFKDDFLLFFRKDKRLNLKKHFFDTDSLLYKLWFSLNLDKSHYGKFFEDEVIFLWYKFWKRRLIGVSNGKIVNRKYKFIWIIKQIKLVDNQIINFKVINKKIINGLKGFYNYYKYADNIDVVMRNLCLFVKKSIRYYVWKNTKLNLFEINTYLNNKKLSYEKYFFE